METVAHSTPYPDVNAVLHVLLSDVQTILASQFIGLYLYGSLATGDFDPHRSDIDFVVVTASELANDMVSALEAMHARMMASGSKWARKLEGTYIPQRALRRYDPNAAPCPCVNEGKFYVARHESDWIIQRYILREHGVTVVGPALHPLIDPVQPEDLRRAVRGFLREWWSPMLHDPARLRSSEYQAYAVLTMCRALYTLQHGDVVSKPVAARWAQQALGGWQAALIEWALAWQPEASLDKFSETLDLIRYTLERSWPIESPANQARVSYPMDQHSERR